jgi:DNA-binding NtrC family response regulator
MVKERTFREDPYYRIEVGTVRLPPLRERRSDIPLLAMAGLRNANRRLTRPKQLSSQALVKLSARECSGNVRGLMNVIERSVQLCPREVIDEKDLQFSDDGAAAATGLPEPHSASTYRRSLTRRAATSSTAHSSSPRAVRPAPPACSASPRRRWESISARMMKAN